MSKHPLFRQVIIIAIVASSIFSIYLFIGSDEPVEIKLQASVKFLSGITGMFFLVIMYIRYKQAKSY